LKVALNTIILKQSQNLSKLYLLLHHLIAKSATGQLWKEEFSFKCPTDVEWRISEHDPQCGYKKKTQLKAFNEIILPINSCSNVPKSYSAVIMQQYNWICSENIKVTLTEVVLLSRSIILSIMGVLCQPKVHYQQYYWIQLNYGCSVLWLVLHIFLCTFLY
jgi:hypothetical protein